MKDVQTTAQQKPPALEREHPALKNSTLIHFLWVIFAHLDPNPCVSGSGSTTLHCKDTVPKIRNKYLQK